MATVAAADHLLHGARLSGISELARREAGAVFAALACRSINDSASLRIADFIDARRDFQSEAALASVRIVRISHAPEHWLSILTDAAEEIDAMEEHHRSFHIEEAIERAGAVSVCRALITVGGSRRPIDEDTRAILRHIFLVERAGSGMERRLIEANSLGLRCGEALVNFRDLISPDTDRASSVWREMDRLEELGLQIAPQEYPSTPYKSSPDMESSSSAPDSQYTLDPEDTIESLEEWLEDEAA